MTDAFGRPLGGELPRFPPSARPEEVREIRHVRQTLDPRLGVILSGLNDSPLQQPFADRISELVTTTPPTPTGDELERVLAPHLWLLRRVGDTGLPLTAAGYLRPADVKELAAILPSMVGWIHRVTTEAHVQPVLHFREHLQAVGLLRKAKGVLHATKIGKQLRDDPAGLWRHLTGRIVPTRVAFDETCATLLLVHLATTEGRLDEDAIVRMMNEMAWGHSDGSPIVRWDVFDVWNPLWWAIGAVGPRDAATEESAWKRIPTPAARALVRDVLFPDPAIGAR
ncbi:hypothetical protein [Microcella indica]|uniref:hypothetical protein n=1 Tax=Microcella indica TaxID=2750620 RepID=UPI0015CF6226|nr:hypothetical protein [Microcella indica]